tara:strand:- start:734 stop:2059 length:1326 start_codon:yes stop_codon:yes gene_type:complete
MAELAFTAQDPSRDFIRATPRNPVLGYLSDLAGSSYSPERTQQMQSVAQFFGAPAISQTLNRMAYGEPLTTGTGGIGGTSKLRPEVAEAAMSVMDFLPTSGIAKGAAMAAPMVAGMFIGKKAVTWDALAAAKAKMLTDMGTDARTIWKETGTWKGPDGKWRQEIDNSVPASSQSVAKIDEITGLPLNADGTVTLFHHTNKNAAQSIQKTGLLKSAGEPSVYLTTERTPTTGYGDTVVPVKVNPNKLNLDDEFPNGRLDFSIDVGKPGGSIKVTPVSLFTAPQEEALRLAQQRASLPISQGGLGLPAGNTPEQRAVAMGFDVPAYHGTNKDFLAFDKNKRGSATDEGWYGSGEYSSPSASGAEAYAMTDFPNYKESANIIPLLVRNPESIKNNYGYVTEYVTREPDQLRSRFAAFDPFRKTAAIAAAAGLAAPDLLAGQEQE